MVDAFAVDFSVPAKDDLSRLFKFLLVRATTAEELECVQENIDELRLAIEVKLTRASFNYRKAGSEPLRRERVVALGATAYVGLFDIQPPARVLVAAMCHSPSA